MLSFFSDLLERLKPSGTKGIFIVLDEINGITADPQFSQFIKGLIDANAASRNPIPILLMLCGVEERRRDMIRKHQPIDRVFDIIDIDPMGQPEMEDFYSKAFASVKLDVDAEAMRWLTQYSAGLPKIMHIMGDCAYWINQDNIIDRDDAVLAVRTAAEEVGKKFVDQQVYNELRSSAYHSILATIGTMGPLATTFL